MAETQLNAPGFDTDPEHYVDIVTGDGRATVAFNRVIVADSKTFMVVYEDDHEPAVYFPRSDVATDMLVATEHQSYCPFKGVASYWTLAVASQSVENAVWSYDAAYQETQALEGLMAFDADKVELVLTGSE